MVGFLRIELFYRYNSKNKTTRYILKTKKSIVKLKNEAMDVLNQIVKESPIGSLSKWSKSIVLSVFSSIVLTLFTMLIAMIMNAPDLHISFGY